ncbi:DUF2306 domain-containing protein [Ningiella sp. W23]|uniref:DUF2306 domain-containing protein n=1 Tax=Ningiella sp. W23 TaxID=3023715 RepID=UPI003756C778
MQQYTHTDPNLPGKPLTLRFLNNSIKMWVLIALIGQWFFTLYILLGFAYPLALGGPQNIDYSHMIEGYVAGDTSGNFILLMHIIPASLLSLSGIFQLVPFIRKTYPRFHRYNGRVFLSIGLLGALSGLYLTWIKGTRLSDFGALGITLNGLLIPIAVYFAWKFARQKQFENHMMWAVHAFILINGVWTFRLYLMSWFVIGNAAFGASPSLEGPSGIFLSYACYLVPMCIAQIYFWGRKQSQRYKVNISIGFVLFGVVTTALGVGSASLFMWWPRIAGAL